jgi:hypothetical protein
MRALLRVVHRWSAEGVSPPESRIPRLADGTLVAIDGLRVPRLPGVTDPRTTEGPGQIAGGAFAPLPFLVPQVDVDGNELAGIRMPDVSVPLATTTGWNFRAPAVGRPEDLYPLLGSYIPFARTLQVREPGDPRASIAERYSGLEDYLRRIDAATAALVKEGFVLEDDVAAIRDRVAAHWDYATGGTGR